MALQLLTAAGAGASREMDVRSVGTRMVPMRVYATGNDHAVAVSGSGSNAALNYVALGTIAASGGSLTIDEPIDYIKVATDAAEGGSVNVFLTTSR